MILDEIDARLKDGVVRELRADPRVNEAEIGVAVEHGVVTLTGRVESEAAKLAAQEAAHRAVGVLDVANDICVVAPFRLGSSDTDLAEAVRNALRRELPASAVRVHSTVHDGWVTLDGAVEDPRERGDAERTVRRLAGVRGVENRIAMGAGGPTGVRPSTE